MAQSDATKLALAFLVVSTMALFAGLALYFDPHMRADGFNGVDANTEGLLQVTQDQAQVGSASITSLAEVHKQPWTHLLGKRDHIGAMLYKKFYDRDLPCGPGPLPDMLTKRHGQNGCRLLCTKSELCLGFVITPDGQRCIFRGKDDVESCKTGEVSTLTQSGRHSRCDSHDGCYNKGYTWYRKQSTFRVVSEWERSKRLRAQRNTPGGGIKWPVSEPTRPPTSLTPSIDKIPWASIKWPGGPRKHEDPVTKSKVATLITTRSPEV